MQLDVPTTMFVFGVITVILSLATLFFSLAAKENRPFIWAALASASFSAAMFLASFRGAIPDFLSIVVPNVSAVISLIAYFELFCRLLDTRPRERILGPIALVFQTGLFIWFTYFQPSFPARVLILNLSLMVIGGCFVRLLWVKADKGQRLLYFFAAIPFGLVLLVGVARVIQIVGGVGLEAPSFTSPLYALSAMFYVSMAIWISLSGVFIVSKRLQVQIREMAMTDPLTGALNRRALRESADREFSRAARKGEPVSLIMADLDHFKQVNDAHGHQAGDAVLTHTVAVFQKILRTEDVLARFGGEEFVALLPGADQVQARTVAERLREALKAEVPLFENRSIPVTASFGVGSDAGRGLNYEELVKAADAALYRAKKQGRDRVVVNE